MMSVEGLTGWPLKAKQSAPGSVGNPVSKIRWRTRGRHPKSTSIIHRHRQKQLYTHMHTETQTSTAAHTQNLTLIKNKKKGSSNIPVFRFHGSVIQ